MQGDLLHAAFERSFGLVSYLINQHLVEHFQRAAQHYNLDYEAIVLWTVLAHANAAEGVRSGPSAYSARGEVRLLPQRLRDLTRLTGIPRETVRRKLLILRERGYVQEGETGWIIDVQAIDVDMRAFSEESMRRLLATAEAVRAALAQAAVPALVPGMPAVAGQAS